MSNNININKKIGIFINNTDTLIKYKININNYNILKKNFSMIIIIDINSKHAHTLKNYIEKDTEYFKYYFILENDNSYIRKIKYIHDSLNFALFQYNYITFIEDNYIYLNSLSDYFNYINNFNLDICPYIDSSEEKYHYRLFLFTVSYNKSIDFFNFVANINENEIYLFSISTYFENIKNGIICSVVPPDSSEFTSKNIIPELTVMPFLKVAYIDCNIGYNVFKNIDYLEFLTENNFLSIISLETLFYFRNSYTFYEYNKIPSDFNINVYKEYEDLKPFDDDFLHKHFVNYGQYEFRKFKKDNYCNIVNTNYILPNFIRKKLHNLNILYYFDLPYEFNIFNYRTNNTDLNSLNINELIFHWVDNGIYENRKYQ